MKAAGLYKDKIGYIFTPLSKTVAGFRISTEPEIRICFGDGVDKVANALKEVINASKENVPTPDFKRSSEESKEIARKKMERLRIKSFSDLDKRPVLYCSAELHSDMIILEPMAHDSDGGVGYVDTKKSEKIVIDFNASDAEIVKAIEETFARCE